MKKIIQINLTGRAISIEEPAYEKLQQYIQQLRRYFASEDSREEILNDIEGRISELLYEKLQRGTDRITEVELEEVIASIGRPEDFEGSFEEKIPSKPTTPLSGQKRLYRDAEDKILGGICSGIASYFSIDPTIVRLLFAIITFGGFGTGFLIYIALWILLPKKSLRNVVVRRLYRNPDDRMLGGVAGGLGAYFNVPVRNIRLIFVAPFLLNMLFGVLDVLNRSLFIDIGVGAFTSTFFLAYIILWIILPEATTTYQKMEMRGEKVDLDRIRQTVRETADQFGSKMRSWGAEVEESARQLSEKAQNFSPPRGRLYGVAHAIGKAIRFFIYLLLGTIAFAFLVAGVTILFAGAVTWPAQQFFWTSSAQQWGFWAMIFFFFVIPCLFLIIFIIRRLFRVRRPAPALGWIFGLMWVIGWIALCWTAVSVLRDFEYKEKVRTDIELSRVDVQTMTLDQSMPSYRYTGTWQWINGDPEGFDITRDTLKLPAVGLRIEPSPDSFYHARLIKYAWGRSEQQAISRIEKIRYELGVSDSLIDLQPGIEVGVDDKYRGQHVVVTLLVPKGKAVRFSRSVWEGHRWLSMRGVGEYEMDHFRPDTNYYMGEDGILYEADGTRVR